MVFSKKYNKASYNKVEYVYPLGRGTVYYLILKEKQNQSRKKSISKNKLHQIKISHSESWKEKLNYKERTKSANKTAVSFSSLGTSLGFHATTKRTEADLTS